MHRTLAARAFVISVGLTLLALARCAPVRPPAAARARVPAPACTDGASADACLRIGLDPALEPDRGRRVAALARGADLLRRGCERDDAAACDRIALLELVGLGVRAAREDALADWDRACRRGRAEACTMAAALLWFGGRPREAGQRLDRACALGAPTDCVLAGRILEDAREPRDLEGVARRYGRACRAGEPEGCRHLGAFTDHEPERATEAEVRLAWENGCALGDGYACTRWGWCLLQGLDAEQDETLAADFFDRGCAEGVPFACGRLAAMRALGVGVPVDCPTAWHLAQRACLGGDDSVCPELEAVRQLCGAR